MPTITPPPGWPSVLVPLPVRFTFDPNGGLFFAMSDQEDDFNLDRHAKRYVETARDLFLPRVADLNYVPRRKPRTPQAITSLPEWEEVEADVRRWLA